MWRKSSYSGQNGGDCLEVREDVPGVVPVRDSKRAEGARLVVSRRAWRAFVNLAKG
ncbi:DUF397 domain-containing protein [Streptomyces sp. YIM 98790]|uniref:DUF397 domain-containing protein n=1 Tax=Streptomyces sp. YIM 98790 TaxID=2689077 RepID=UPI001409F706|nr:DUF397 domain-containing protein [Streptomyces sp. YIM 98790]